MQFEDLPLREQKFARTKLGLMREAVDMLSDVSLDELSVRTLCRRVEVSEATFYNYFPHKTDLLTYFVAIWTLEVMWLSRHRWNQRGIDHINCVFEYTAATSTQDSAMMGEIIAFLARVGIAQPSFELSLAERLLALPNCPGIEDLPTDGFDAAILPAIDDAYRCGDIPESVPRQVVDTGLITLFFGMPISLHKRHLPPPDYVEMVLMQLDVFWRGLGAGRGVSHQRLFRLDADRAVPLFDDSTVLYPVFLREILQRRLANQSASS